jgi:hypothetical protein
VDFCTDNKKRTIYNAFLKNAIVYYYEYCKKTKSTGWVNGWKRYLEDLSETTTTTFFEYVKAVSGKKEKRGRGG